MTELQPRGVYSAVWSRSGREITFDITYSKDYGHSENIFPGLEKIALVFREVEGQIGAICPFEPYVNMAGIVKDDGTTNGAVFSKSPGWERTRVLASKEFDVEWLDYVNQNYESLRGESINDVALRRRSMPGKYVDIAGVEQRPYSEAPEWILERAKMFSGDLARLFGRGKPIFQVYNKPYASPRKGDFDIILVNREQSPPPEEWFYEIIEEEDIVVLKSDPEVTYFSNVQDFL